MNGGLLMDGHSHGWTGGWTLKILKGIISRNFLWWGIKSDLNCQYFDISLVLYTF